MLRQGERGPLGSSQKSKNHPWKRRGFIIRPSKNPPAKSLTTMTIKRSLNCECLVTLKDASRLRAEADGFLEASNKRLRTENKNPLNPLPATAALEAALGMDDSLAFAFDYPLESSELFQISMFAMDSHSVLYGPKFPCTNMHDRTAHSVDNVTRHLSKLTTATTA